MEGLKALSRREKVCAVEECSTRHYAKGYCKKHHAQILRHGRLTPERERGTVRACAAPDCDRTDTIRGYCRRHARQIRVHGALTPEREHLVGVQGCRVKGCRGPHRAKGFCAKHYNEEHYKQLKGATKPKKAKSRKGK